MKKAKLALISVILGLIVLSSLSSCTAHRRTMREPNARVEFKKDDFALSDQVTAEAKTTRVFGIDFRRLFDRRSGNYSTPYVETGLSLASIPIIGNVVRDRESEYAIYELMRDNPGYDVVFSRSLKEGKPDTFL